MNTDWWGRPKPARNAYQKAWSRNGLARWDEKWHTLSKEARLAFVDEVKPVVKNPSRSVQPSVPGDRFDARVLEELVDAGFVRVETSKRAGNPHRVLPVPEAYHFSARVRAARRDHLLSGGGMTELYVSIHSRFYSDETFQLAVDVLSGAGIDDSSGWGEDMLVRYCTNHRWPDWVARSSSVPHAAEVLAVVTQADAPVLLAELLEGVQGATPDEVRSALDDLVLRLAVFEDLDPQTLDLHVGLLPAVREALDQGTRPRPPLEVCEAPSALGPEGSLIVDDLRAFLLELSSEPPRLRQNRSFFQKELPRFYEALPSLPDWFSEALETPPEFRLKQAGAWAQGLNLVRTHVSEKHLELQLSPDGEKWLAGGLEYQYEYIFNYINYNSKENERRELLVWNAGGEGNFYSGYAAYERGDRLFLGIDVISLPVKKGANAYQAWAPKPSDRAALRASIDRAFDGLEPDVYYRLDSVFDHISFGEHNPLLLGRSADQVQVFFEGRKLPPFEERSEDLCRKLLDVFVRRRLIPLGCLRTALDDAGRLCVARRRAFDVYFGREGAKLDVAAVETETTRVIVQPDFSVIIIGLNPAPVAELSPFCERASRQAASGAVVLKLTRDAVVKAVTHGLSPRDMIDRLKRQASNELPANVLVDVQTWCDWVRQVQPETLTVLRCGDRETADRVQSALGKQAERLTPVLVAVPEGSLSASVRARLLAQGVVVPRGGASAAAKPEARSRTGTRRRRRG